MLLIVHYISSCESISQTDYTPIVSLLVQSVITAVSSFLVSFYTYMKKCRSEWCYIYSVSFLSYPRFGDLICVISTSFPDELILRIDRYLL